LVGAIPIHRIPLPKPGECHLPFCCKFRPTESDADIDRYTFIVAATPGHEQYTHNMATGASTTVLAIILVDARNGILQQTRRHSYIVPTLGVRRSTRWTWSASRKTSTAGSRKATCAWLYR
jgi:Elongation factor Tu GTP binding domain